MGVSDTNGICIGPEDMSGLKMQIDDLPQYENMGTNGKIAGGPPPDVCKIATQVICGLTGGSGLKVCKKVDTSVPHKARGDKMELIQSTASDSTPNSADRALSKSKKLAAEAAYSSGVIATETAAEKKDSAEAAKLNGEQEKLTAAAQKENREQKEALAAAGKSATQQSKAASKATKEAVKKSEAVQKKYKDEVAAIAAAGVKATDKAKARVAATKKAVEAAANAVKAEEGKQTAIAAAEGATKGKLQDEMDAAGKAFTGKMKALGEEKKESEAGFSKEAKKINAANLKRVLKNKEEETKMKKVLSDEVAANKKDEEAEKAKIAKDDKEAQDALAKVNRAKDKVAKATLDAENARRGKEKDAKDAKEVESKDIFKKASAKAADLKAKAVKAEDAVKESIAQGAEEAKEEAATNEAEDAEDDAEAECATDGSECQECVNTGEDKEKCTCEKVSEAHGPFIDDVDGFSCSSTKPVADAVWYHVSEAQPPTPLVAEDQDMCDKIEEDATGILKGAFDSHDFPLEVVACDQDSTFEQKLGLINKVFEHAAVCVPYCFPGTATMTDDNVADSNGICIGPEDMKALKDQIDNTVQSHDDTPTGTNGWMGSGPEPDLCKMARNLMCGLEAGSGLPECAAVDTSEAVDTVGYGDDEDHEDHDHEDHEDHEDHDHEDHEDHDHEDHEDHEPPSYSS